MKFNQRDFQHHHEPYMDTRPTITHYEPYNDPPPEIEVPLAKKSPLRRWYFRFAAYLLILTFVSGFTFGAGYLTASYYGQSLPAMNPAPSAVVPTGSPSPVQDEGINITQVQSIITDASPTTSTIASVAKKVSPAIVTIASYTDRTPNGFFGNSNGFYGGTGSGIIFSAEGNELLIVTNYHVIEGASKLEVIFHDGSKVSAQSLGYNSRLDLAVLSVPLDQANAHLDNIVMATFGNSDKVQVGELAVAIGNPLGPDYALTVTAGIISALGRDISIDQNTTQVNLIQTDAAINPGNSGGALLNGNGEVIGINSAKYVSESVEGIGFAIPINDAQETIKEILASREGKDLAYALSDDRAFLGVSISDITASINQATGMSFGVYITAIIPGGGAEKAGFQVGDIIYNIDGDRIRNTSELFRVLEAAKVGDTITIGFVRDNELMEAETYLFSYKDVMAK